eukprot:SAG31_NODE_21_length_34109_cov_60.598824_22_plen_48_part_00
MYSRRMVAVVFVGPVGGVDDVGIRGGGCHALVWQVELNGRLIDGVLF